MFEFASSLIAAPVLPATILLGVLLVWSLMTIVIGGLDSHVAASWHLHNPFSEGPFSEGPFSEGPFSEGPFSEGPFSGGPFSGGHGDGDGLSHTISHALGDAMGTVVLAPANWLNLKQLPIVLWAGIFTLAWWSFSILIWVSFDSTFFNDPGFVAVGAMILRNLTLGLLSTKLITQPMRGWFDTNELTSVSLVGQEAEICSFDATPENGQVKYKTSGAPLLLNVRTDGPHLPKGTRVWLTHYDTQKRIYIVSATTTTSKISPTGSKQ